MVGNGRARRERYFDLYRDNLAFYDQDAGDAFVCPLCRRKFPRWALDTDPPLLTLAHIIPESQGGTTCTLACADCNNGIGHSLEAALLRQFRQEDWLAGVGTQDGRIVTECGPVTVQMRHSPEAREWHLNVIQQRSNPANVRSLQALAESRRDQPNPGVSFQLQWRGVYSLDVTAALYHAAYMLLFSHFGYEVLLWSEYDALRNWVREPTEGGWRRNIQVMSEESARRLLKGNRQAILFLPEQRVIMAVLRLCPEDGRERVLGVALPGPNSPDVPDFETKNFKCLIVPYDEDVLRQGAWYLSYLWRELVEQKGG